VQLAQVVSKSRLLQDAKRSVVGSPQEIHDPQCLVLSQRRIRSPGNAQLARAAIALEPVEQYAPLVRVHALQRFLDASLRDRGEQAPLQPRIPHPVALVPQIQGRKLHLACHGEPLRGVVTQVRQNIVDPSAAHHAVLSHRPGQHLQIFELALLRAVVPHAARGGTPAAVCIFAPKRTTKVTAPGVTWMGQEQDPAMPATSQAAPQVRLGPQDGTQDAIILKHESKHFARAVPIRAELDKLSLQRKCPSDCGLVGQFI